MLRAEEVRWLESRWCTCITAYQIRNLYDPQCAFHAIGEDLIEEALALVNSRTT